MAKLTLAAIAASCVEVEIEIAGQRLRALPLSSDEMALVEAALPPHPRGEEADPIFRRERAEWSHRLRCGVVAAAVLRADPSQIDGGVWPEGVKKAGELLGKARHTEVVAAFDALTYGGPGEKTPAERAEGN